MAEDRNYLAALRELLNYQKDRRGSLQYLLGQRGFDVRAIDKHACGENADLDITGLNI